MADFSRYARNTYSSSFIALAVFLIAVLFAYSPRPFSPSASQVSQADDLCTVTATALVSEQQADGRVEPFEFAGHTDVDPAKWGISDTLHRIPYAETDETLSFNHPTRAQYEVFANGLTLVPFPRDNEIYQNEQLTDIRLVYQKDIFKVLRHSIRRCSRAGSTEWQCPQRDTDQNALSQDLIRDVPLTCGIELEVEWIVQRRTPGDQPDVESSGFSQSRPAVFVLSDLDGDGVTNIIDLGIILASYGTNDPLADVNDDGRVNGNDYSIVVHDILNDSL